MSGVLKRVTLPAEARGWAARLELKRWVDRKSWNTELRYQVVDRARQAWTAMGHLEFADDPRILVNSTYQYFVNDQEFLAYVLGECEQDITDAGEWDDVAKAYAWVVLQRYNRDLGGQDD